MADTAPPGLPGGVVTFLFTDIGGSTRLFQHWGDRWPALLHTHDAIVTAAFVANDGVVVSHEGDGFLAVFADADAAVRAAARAQAELAAHEWPSDGEIRIRVGLHTGYAVPHERNYVALAVHQAARVVQAAHPGQTLLTEATAAALHGGGPAAPLEIRALGAHRLKDFDVPQQLFELHGPGLAGNFPPLPGVWRGANNLPLPRSSFIGRVHDAAEVRRLFDRARLVTIAGPGGAGKTRLSMQVAASVLDGSGDGVWLVELAALSTDASTLDIAAAAMKAIGIGEQRGRTHLETLVDELRQRRLLVILDNCEHLAASAADLADALLTQCPNVTVLATSRQPLDLDGEHLYRLPALSLPPSGLPLSPEEAIDFEAVQLFVERARAHSPTFELDDQTVSDVVAVCRRLEGLPLAIELAAARLRSLPVTAIAGRLDDQLTLLVGAQRSAAPRQQTMRALLDWSHELLTEDEQRLFRRVAVFAGGWTIDAALAVAGDPHDTEAVMLDRLSSLVDKSLVQAEAIAGDVRFSLLETMRQYAADRLDASGEQALIGELHCDHFLALAEQARVELNTKLQRTWLDRLDREDGNLRAALAFAMSRPERTSSALRLVTALSSYWVMRGRAAEGMQHADRVLAVPQDESPTGERAGALASVAALLMRSGEFARARTLLDEALRIATLAGDARRSAVALNDLAWLANRREELDAARAHAMEALSLAETIGENHLAGRVHATLGDLEERCADTTAARVHFEEARRRFDEVGDLSGSAKMLNNLGLIDLTLGDRAAARRSLEECLAIFSELQDVASLPTVLSNLGLIAVEDGEHRRGQELFSRGLRLGYRSRDKELMTYTTLGLALTAGGLAEDERAMTLHGVADALAADVGMSMDPLEAGLRERSQAELRNRMGAAADVAHRSGLTMDVDDAMAYALHGTDEPAATLA